MSTAPASVKPRLNNLALASILLAVVVPAPAICLGAIALTQIDETRERGRFLAFAAIVVSGLVLTAMSAAAAFIVGVNFMLTVAPWIVYL